MKAVLITRRVMVNKIAKTNGKVFRVTFTKRSTGEDRELICRLGVSKGITGKGMSYDAPDKGLMVVYDFENKGYRMIALEGLKELKFQDVLYRVKK